MIKCNNPKCGYENKWKDRYKICPKCGYVMHPVKEKIKMFGAKKVEEITRKVSEEIDGD